MSDEIKINRPSVQTAPVEVSTQTESSSKMPWIVLGVVIVVLIVVGVLFRDKLTGSGTKAVKTAASSGYQAIFLTNGQVYFGKLSKGEDEYVTLKEIYYLQVVQPPLQGQQQPGEATQQTQPQISLVKLGNELHGPVDEMKITKSQILFYESMKEDSQVVTAIKNYKANPQGAGAPAAPAPAAPAPAAPAPVK
jgi:hypothetical protein